MAGQKWLNLSVMGAVALATLFAFLAVFTTWATDGDTDVRATGYGMDGISSIQGDNTITMDMNNKQLDDTKGIGMMRAGSVLAVIGLCFFVVALIALENEWLTGHDWLGLVGLGAGALGALLWLVAMILFPIGIGAVAKDINFVKPDLTWGAGFVFSIFTTVLSLGAVITAGVARAMASGFRLELADGERNANFD